MANKKIRSKDSTDIFIVLLRVLVVLLIVFCVFAQNNLVVTRNFIYSDIDLPKSLVGYKILHISDICNTTNTSSRVLSSAVKSKPDIIVLSGGYQDINGEYSNTVELVKDLCEIAPVYYIYNTNDTEDVLSNTNAINITDMAIELEVDIKDAETFIEKVYGKGIVNKASKGDEKAVQYVQYITDELNNQQHSVIKLCGISNMVGDYSNKIQEHSYNITGSIEDELTIMINGNLNNIQSLCSTNLDIMFVGGTFGKKSGDMQYSKGDYGCLGTKVFVSGGCGNYKGSRILNLPEVQLITLSDGTIKEESPLEKFIDLFIDDVGTIYDNDGGFSEYKYEY